RRSSDLGPLHVTCRRWRSWRRSSRSPGRGDRPPRPGDPYCPPSRPRLAWHATAMTPRSFASSSSLALALGFSLLLTACDGGGDQSGATRSGTTAGTGGAGGGGSSGGAGGSAAAPLIYAHTDTTLYTLDATSANLDLTPIGDFDCVPSQTSAMT